MLQAASQPQTGGRLLLLPLPRVTCHLPWNTVGRCSVHFPCGEQLHGHGLDAQPQNCLLLGHDWSRRSTKGGLGRCLAAASNSRGGFPHTLRPIVTGHTDTQGCLGGGMQAAGSSEHHGFVFSLLVHLNFLFSYRTILIWRSPTRASSTDHFHTSTYSRHRAFTLSRTGRPMPSGRS